VKLTELGVGLGGGEEDRRHRDVVGAVAEGLARLIGGRHGHSEEHRGADQAAGLGCREVVLAHVHPVGAGSERHVDPVVDDERHAGSRQDALKLADLLEETARAKRLLPDLDGGDAAPQRATDDLGERPAAGEVAVRHEVQAEAVAGEAHRATSRIRPAATRSAGAIAARAS